MTSQFLVYGSLFPTRSVKGGTGSYLSWELQFLAHHLLLHTEDMFTK